MEMNTIPANIGKAISEVMTKVRYLQKEDKNKHGGYNFASIDKFLEIVGGACAEAGLIIMQDEVEVELLPSPAGKGSWLRAKYEFWLSHSSGESMSRPFTRTVMVQATGGQAFGSAQSYTLKQFQRSLFQIATGDKDDVDFQPNEEIDVDPARMTPTERKKAGLWQGPLQVTALKHKMRDLSAALKAAESQSFIHDLTSNEFADVLSQCAVDLPDWYDKAIQAIDQALKGLPEHAEPETDDRAIPVPSANGGADWNAWAQMLTERVNSAETPADVDAWALANEPALTNLEKADEQTSAYVWSQINNRKHELEG